MNNMHELLSDHLGGMQVAKSLSMEKNNEQRFRHITEDVTDQMVRLTVINSATRMYYDIGTSVALAVFPCF